MLLPKNHGSRDTYLVLKTPQGWLPGAQERVETGHTEELQLPTGGGILPAHGHQDGRKD
jgi:hypothetical protein